MAWIPTLSQLGQQRQIQLEKERTIDHLLQEKRDECPQKIIEYFSRIRSLHRHMTERLYEAPFYEYPSRMKEYMLIIDKLQNPLLKKARPNICNALDETIEQIKLENNKIY